MRNVVTVLAAAVVCAAGVVFTGCGGSEGGAGWAGTVDTLPSGTVRVSNTTRSAAPEAAGWSLREELRIRGGVDDPERFSRVNDLAVDGWGRVFVLDADLHQVQLFDSDGSFLRRFGREGEGPGELASPHGLALHPGGRVWVLDLGANRVTVFDTTGAYVGSHRRNVGGFHVPWEIAFPSEGDAIELVGTELLVRLDSTLSPLDSLDVPPFEGEMISVRMGQATMGMPVPFSPSRHYAVDRTGALWLGMDGEYRFARLTPDGDTTLVIEVEAERIPVTEAERAEELASLEPLARRGADIDPDRIPDLKPYFERMFSADDGSLWVVRTGTSPPRDARIDILDPDGRYTGFVRMPEIPQAASHFTGDHIYAVVRGPLDVMEVVRYRVVRDA